MSDPTSRLPARPSLEQLRKQAKERLAALRIADPAVKLADAQFRLAREYGFDSWPKLVHHIASSKSSARIEQFERIADDLLAGYNGDSAALQRLIGHFGVAYNEEQLRIRVRRRIEDSRGDGPGEPSLSDARQLVAHQYGFTDWTALVSGLDEPGEPTRDTRWPVSGGPPFYRIDGRANTIEPQPPLSDRDWESIFAIMRERRLTGIRTPALTDSAMERLAKLDFVTSIDGGGAQALTDDGLLHLAAMPQLEEIDLGGWHSRLTDRGLAVLQHLPNLRVFSMCWPQRITDSGAAQLAACERLERVELMGTPTGDGALRALRGRPRLTKLLTGKQVTDSGLLLLHDFPGFRSPTHAELELGLMTAWPDSHTLQVDGPFTDRGLASLVGLDGLLALGLFWHSKNFTGAGLAQLASLPRLSYLGCQGERCDDAAMASISTLPALRMLMAQGAVATDDGFAALSRSQTIEYIWGRECPNLRGAGFRALAEMPRLRGLGVSCKGVDDASLASLSSFPALRDLMPMDVSDDRFQHVGACKALRGLWCMYCRDTGDSATEHVAGLALQRYYAGRTKITDRSLELLGSMPSLEWIELWETARITDFGVRALAKLPRLREISISGTPRVTSKSIAAFGPGVRVDFRS